MRTIVHISDIHFGRADAVVVERLVEKINEIDPNVTVVSGDLTQRARDREFVQAKNFLQRIPGHKIVVPGNHDVPLYNVFQRFFFPLEKFKKYITPDPEPFFADDEVAVLGVNTARSLTIKGGRINGQQLKAMRAKLCLIHGSITKMVVTHHPFDLPEGHDEDDIVGGAIETMAGISDCGADVFLAGHLHVSHIGHSARRYKLQNGRSALIVQAGTAASTRVRGEVNSFNTLEIKHPLLTVKRFECASADTDFALATSEVFTCSETGWTRL